ncbi:MAG: hypothetical protein HY906_20570 [Deltaproteobacteria bacterium]|nr:hypothetical protein [Deltaproteobacteria bacterium]
MLAVVILALPASGAAQRAGGYKAMEREAPPASQPAPSSQPGARPAPAPVAGRYETVIEASPMWTQDRNFLGTRLWKRDRGTYGLGFWYRPEFYRDRPSKHRFQLELEIGLTQRLQLDIYENVTFNKDGPDGGRTFSHQGIALELRIAIPKRYGTIWGNPVVYLEYVSNHDAPDKAEAKLLLGGELFTPRLLGVINLVFECLVNKLRGEPYKGEPEFGLTAAASYEVMRQHLRLGAEARLIFESGTFGAVRRGDVETLLLLGPNVAWHVVGRHLKLYATMFFGVTEAAPRYAPWVILATSW